MPTKKIPQRMGLLGCAAGALATASFADQCYSYPAIGGGPGALSQDLEAEYQRYYDYETNRGTDMQAWADTAKFAFNVVFASVGPDGINPDPKDGSEPDPQPADTLSSKAYKAWAQVLFSQYPIYDYYDPTTRLSAPVDPQDILSTLLGTRATMLAISKECFVHVMEPGSPQKPVRTKPALLKNGSPKNGLHPGHDVVGRIKKASAIRMPVILFGR